MNKNILPEQKNSPDARSLAGDMRLLSKSGSGSRRKSLFANYMHSQSIDGDFINQKNDIVKIFASTNVQEAPIVNKSQEKGADRADKHVYLGDVIYISWNLRDIEKASKSSGVLYGEKYANKHIQFKLSKDGFANISEEGCLFQIVNLSEESNETEFLDSRKLSETKNTIYSNKDQKKTKIVDSDLQSKIRLLYGQGFSLKHIVSGKYLSIKPFFDTSNLTNVKDDSKQAFSRFLLTEEEDVDSYFKFYPTNKLSQTGVPMDYEEPIFFKDEFKNVGYTIKLSESKFDEAKLTIISNETTDWQFSFYADAKSFSNTQKENLKRCEIVQIFDSDTNEYLTCEPKDFKQGKKARIYFPIDSKPSSMPCIEVSELNNIENEEYTVKFCPESKYSIFSFWQIRWKKPLDNCQLTNEDEIHFINLVSNTYLTLQITEAGRYILSSMNVPVSGSTYSFEILNIPSSLITSKIDINSKFAIKAKIFGRDDQRVDVMNLAFKEKVDHSSKNSNPTKYSQLSMKKINESSLSLMTIIDLKFIFEKLHEFFYGWGTKSFTQSLNVGDVTQTNVNYYKFDHDLAAKTKYSFNVKLEEFKTNLKTLRNLLLSDYSNFVDIEDCSNQNSAVSHRISEQIFNSHILNLVIEILKISVARYFKICKIVATENKGETEGILRNYEHFLDLEKSLKQNETREKIAPIDAMENYEKLISLILKFLSRFSYKNVHVQTVVLDNIDTIFPLLALYKVFVKQILLNVLINKAHPQIHYLQSVLLSKFADGNLDAYFVNMANMFNLVAKAIKHNEVSFDIDDDIDRINLAIKNYHDLLSKCSLEDSVNNKKLMAEKQQLSKISVSHIKSQNFEESPDFQIKLNNYMDHIHLQPKETPLKSGSSVSEFSKSLESVEDYKLELCHSNKIMETRILLRIAEEYLDVDPERLAERIEDYLALINHLNLKEKELTRKKAIKERIISNQILKSKIISIHDANQKDSEIVISNVEVATKKELTDTVITIKEEETSLNKDLKNERRQATMKLEFRLEISQGLINRGV
jgi:hypothetical protein